MPGTQHYIPQQYLNAFTNDKKKIAVYDKMKNICFFANPRNIFAEKDFFNLNLEGIDENFTFNGAKIEPTILDQQLNIYEAETGRILKLLRINNPISPNDFFYLLEFMRWLLFATNDTKNFYMKKYEGQIIPQMPGIFINLHKKMKPFFSCRVWRFEQCQNLLITSDNPINLNLKLQTPKDIDTLLKTAICFPIAPNQVILGYPSDGLQPILVRPKGMTAAHIAGANDTIYQNAKRFLVSHDMDILRDIVERNSAHYEKH